MAASMQLADSDV